MALTENISFLTVTFTQLTSPGSVSIPGLKSGDVLVSLNFDPPTGDVTLTGLPWYEGIVTVDDELQQKNSTTTPKGLRALFVRGAG